MRKFMKLIGYGKEQEKVWTRHGRDENWRHIVPPRPPTVILPMTYLVQLYVQSVCLALK
jgi:hypothetical protein